jgi:hypothetical protein
MIAPGGGPAVSAPEALAAAMRELAQPAPADNGDDADDGIPVAEVVHEPAPPPRPAVQRSAGKKATPLAPEAAAALAGLDALARAAPPKPAARPAAKAEARKAPAVVPGRAAPAAGGPSKSWPLANNPILIAIAAAIGIAVVLLVAALFVGGKASSRKRDQPPEPPPPPVTNKTTKRDWGEHPPGELFPNVKPQN